MIGALTSDYETGLKILDKIKELKIVKHSEKISHIYGYSQIIYLYSDDDVRNSHESEMIADGWSKVDAQTYTSIYSNLYTKQYLRVPCNVYEREIEAISIFPEDI